MVTTAAPTYVSICRCLNVCVASHEAPPPHRCVWLNKFINMFQSKLGNVLYEWMERDKKGKIWGLTDRKTRHRRVGGILGVEAAELCSCGWDDTPTHPQQVWACTTAHLGPVPASCFCMRKDTHARTHTLWNSRCGDMSRWWGGLSNCPSSYTTVWMFNRSTAELQRHRTPK